jgi:hypothetical protein
VAGAVAGSAGVVGLCALVGAVGAATVAAGVFTETAATGFAAGVAGAVACADAPVAGATDAWAETLGVGCTATAAVTCAGPAATATAAPGTPKSSAHAGSATLHAQTAAAMVTRRRAARAGVREGCDTCAR